ncbi:hypothetical protein GCM10011395_35990 [Sphingomonas psychrolutea]|uniref:Uncharacterized protein n=1 Tax=Sphingomonas psychrolutea TaxID=1259676 RepID=A0ABQ1H8Y9_9SPHN|nr:hypothetical protein GCM10011395_35990 [Sphingomonas psychrolutea]
MGPAATHSTRCTGCTGWREAAINDWLRNPIFYEAPGHPAD